MLKTAIAAAVIAAAAVGLAPTAQARPLLCARHDSGEIYIHACANGAGNGGTRPFFAILRDPVTGKPIRNATTNKVIRVCKDACHKLDPEDRIQNGPIPE